MTKNKLVKQEESSEQLQAKRNLPTTIEADYAITKSIGGKTLAENMHVGAKKLAKHDKELNLHFGRSKTQARWNLIRFDEANTSAARLMNQIAAESTRKRQALVENKKNLADKWLEMENPKLCLNTSPEGTLNHKKLMVEYAHLQQTFDDAKLFIEGALKDINDLDDTYECAKAKFVEDHGRDFTPEDFEREDAKGHVMQGVRLAVRDIRMTGKIALSAQMYLENFGINISMIHSDIELYLIGEREYAELDRLCAEKKAINRGIKEGNQNAINAKNRYKYLCKKYRGKVKKRHISGVELHKFVEKMSEKYADAAAEKLKVFGLPTELNKDNFKESGIDSEEKG